MQRAFELVSVAAQEVEGFDPIHHEARTDFAGAVDIEADLDAAIAETKVAEQEALKRAAEVKGYPSVEDYLRAEAIKQGLNPWQPTYVVPQAG